MRYQFEGKNKPNFVRQMRDPVIYFFIVAAS